jgi:hypothetical protein
VPLHHLAQSSGANVPLAANNLIAAPIVVPIARQTSRPQMARRVTVRRRRVDSARVEQHEVFAVTEPSQGSTNEPVIYERCNETVV